MNTLVMRRPDDWHLHLRDGASLEAVLPFSAARFARAIVMPNLAPPVTSTEAALAYRGRILAALPPGARFEPLMTLYLTDATPAAEIERARASGCVLGCKLYPACEPVRPLPVGKQQQARLPDGSARRTN